MAALNKDGESHLNSLIEQGKYDASADWSFSADDGDKLLGSSGDDWKRYGSVHLGEDAEAANDTKGHWKYPAAKADGDGEKVFRQGLVAAKQRAAQQKDGDIETAASGLIDLIDEKEGKDKETAEPKPDEEARAAIAGAEGVKRTLARGRDLARLMTRVFDTPLMIAPSKLEVMMPWLAPRLLGQVPLGDVQGDDDGDEEDKPYDMTADGVAMMSIDGTLVYKSGWLGALSGLVSYSSIGDRLAKALADPGVKGILLCVDSFGGEVNGCFDLADAIYNARSQKPVYAVASDNAMSAGYALASAAEKLFVSRTSGIGSIGVVAVHVDESGADKAEGVKYTYIASGAKKTDGNPHEPLSDTARATMQAEVDRVRELFAGSVAKYRGISVDGVLGTEAAKFYGENAVAAKLADAVGTPSDALAALRARLDPQVIVIGTPGVAGGGNAARTVNALATQAREEKVIDLDSIRAEGARGKASEIGEIVELCKLAKMPERAGEFIAANKTVAQVRDDIQRIRAEASDARSTAGHIMPDAGTNNAQEIAKSWERAFAASAPQPARRM